MGVGTERETRVRQETSLREACERRLPALARSGNQERVTIGADGHDRPTRTGRRLGSVEP